MNKVLATFSLAVACTCAAFAQSDSTISRAGDLQLGGGYSMAKPDYGPKNLSGFNLYGTFDFYDWIGIEASFHHTSAGDASKIYERTYEIGPRVFYRYHRLTPYAKILIGRGVFNYPPDCLDKTTHFPTYCTSPNVDPSTTDRAANIAYNEFSFGGGLDIAVHPRINVRVDYEYQDWFGFPPTGLTPQVYSVGVAYHFGGGNLSIR